MTNKAASKALLRTRDVMVAMTEDRQRGQSARRPWRRIFVPLFMAAMTAVMLMAGEALATAEEGAHHSVGFMPWFWATLNFVLFVAILAYFLKKPLTEYLKHRTELIQKTLEEAKQARQLAEKALAEIDEKLKLKDEEIEKIISTARKYGESEKDRIIADARAVSAKLKELTDKNIAFELKKAKDAVRTEAVDILTGMAEKKITGLMTETAKTSLLDDAINQLGKNNN